MSEALSGKIALVTGAARGIGRSIALKLAGAGCDVAVNYRGGSHDAEALVAEIVALGRSAVAVGAEKTGLTAEVIAGAEHRVRIPMVGRANSLNVATSAAIIVYEAVRQRRRA